MRTSAKIVLSAALLGIGTLALGARAYAEGGLTLEERVQRLERQREMPPPTAAAPDVSGLQSRIDALDQTLMRTGTADGERVFNLTWHDWMNLKSLIAVSRVIATAALAREDSRGAHFREDHPETGSLAQSDFTVVRESDGRLALTREPVRFSRVRPGETLIRETAKA